MPQFITNSFITVNLPFITRLSDVFQAEEQIAVEWISPEDNRVSLFDGLYEYEQNTSETFTIRGKPGFCSAVTEELDKHGRIVDKRPQNPSVKFWIHLSGKRA
ncbi:hypothetical protein JNL27_02955 [bacterium]|nr:hypothetical protein [bacterium]